jgi:prolyl-tRNA synthetase
MSQLFSQTLREAPAEADTASHQLLLRAGFIRQLAAGIFSYLPLASARPDQDREHHARGDGRHRRAGDHHAGRAIPADMWQETRRWYEIGAEMGASRIAPGGDMVLAMTHEEVVADLVRKEIRSYRQLPRCSTTSRPSGATTRARAPG